MPLGVYQREDGVWDLALDDSRGEHLQLDESLRTWVLLILNTNARVSAEDDPQSRTLLGGFWGDSYPQDGDSRSSRGSKLWLLQGRKTTDATLLEAKTWAEEALSVLIEARAAAEIVVTPERVSDTVLGASIYIRKPAELSPQFVTRWEMTLTA